MICPNIDALFAGDGDTNIGNLHPVVQVGVASDPRKALAMLRGPADEPPDVLLRLDSAVATAFEHSEFTH